MEQRYFLQLSYFGKNFVGWQEQPNGESVQSTIERTLNTILQQEIKIVGCGRTDTGVHASKYFLHFDGPQNLPKHFLDRINKMVGTEIAFQALHPVGPESHARFDAYERSYTYFAHGKKNPFIRKTSTFFSQLNQLDFDAMQSVCSLLPTYQEFLPFCKTNSDALTYKCQVTNAEWRQPNSDQWEFHITSNRFLRGMVRLIVGMSFRVGMGKMSQVEVKEAMDNQTSLAQSYSAPAEGLFLSDIKYPYIK